MAKMMINGKPTDAASGATMEVRNPATGEVVDRVPKAGAEDTRRAIEAAGAAFPAWARLSPQKRAQTLMRASARVREHLDEVAQLLTSEQGKPIRDARIEARRFVENVELYAGLVGGGALSGKYIPLPGQGAMGLVVRKPLGIVGAIKIGAVPIPLNTRPTPEDYRYILDDCRARVAIVSASLLPQLQEIAPGRLRHLRDVVVASGKIQRFKLRQVAMEAT